MTQALASQRVAMRSSSLLMLIGLASTASCAGTYGYRSSIGATAGTDGSVGVMLRIGVHAGLGTRHDDGGDGAVVVLEGEGTASTKSSGAGFGFGLDYIHFGPLAGRIGVRNEVLFGGSDRPSVMPSIVAAIGKPVGNADQGPTVLGVELRVGLPFEQVDGRSSVGTVQFFLGASIERHRWWKVDFLEIKR